MLKAVKSRGISISKQEMLKCMVGSLKACYKTYKKQLLFAISAQTALVTILENISVFYLFQASLNLSLHQMLACP